MVIIAAMTGCSNNKTTEATKVDYDWKEYVELGEYKDLPFYTEEFTVTDEEVDEQIETILLYATEIETIMEGVVEDGDTINITFVGKIDAEEFEIKICVSAQHRNMLDQTLQIFNVIPDYDLDIMRKSQSLSDITSKTLIGLEKIFAHQNPDLVLVHGDTSTTFSAALAAFYNKIKIGHVEAGLRTFNKFEPFPEEINRKLVADLADLNFTPTKSAKTNLINEGVDEKSIFVTGNTAIDCIRYTLKNDYKFKNEQLNKYLLNQKI